VNGHGQLIKKYIAFLQWHHNLSWKTMLLVLSTRCVCMAMQLSLLLLLAFSDRAWTSYEKGGHLTRPKTAQLTAVRLGVGIHRNLGGGPTPLKSRVDPHLKK
jgi:hypothetical protein